MCDYDEDVYFEMKKDLLAEIKNNLKIEMILQCGEVIVNLKFEDKIISSTFVDLDDEFIRHKNKEQ